VHSINLPPTPLHLLADGDHGPVYSYIDSSHSIFNSVGGDQYNQYNLPAPSARSNGKPTDT